MLDPEKVMLEATEPVFKMIDFKNLTALPKFFADFDYNESRGESARLAPGNPEPQEKARSLSEALGEAAT